jgi:hypothetical protein
MKAQSPNRSPEFLGVTGPLAIRQVQFVSITMLRTLYSMLGNLLKSA